MFIYLSNFEMMGARSLSPLGSARPSVREEGPVGPCSALSEAAGCSVDLCLRAVSSGASLSVSLHVAHDF